MTLKTRPDVDPFVTDETGDFTIPMKVEGRPFWVRVTREAAKDIAPEGDAEANILACRYQFEEIAEAKFAAGEAVDDEVIIRSADVRR